ncbi:excinuclease ABC subunit UvrB [bacterium (Candidatus Howlettbacteria) CG_4_10_14_0_8_um_filter_40_9]|nr:MAG: excinuclease ABC subunit UvrB [bacterium (Candidatus Howlettbacteria) CG_4_10_14_0_8_um_filter_40_9]
MKFKLESDYKPKGDQPEAIKQLASGLAAGKKYQTLLGVTGSGKTFTMANIIEKTQKPTLIISHNKTLSAQLYEEFKEYFPENAVHFFVSYYDYYQPEAYVPRTDTYIEKDASINEEIDRLRHASTSSLLSRNDVIVIASVSCIYGIGEPKEYMQQSVEVFEGQEIKREELIRQLIDVQYERNEIDFSRGKVRARGGIVDIFPVYEEATYRVEFFGNKIESIKYLDPLTGEIKKTMKNLVVFPAKHFVTSKENITKAIDLIKNELQTQVAKMRKQGKLLEAQRLEQRTNYDIEMMMETGYCSGIENYSLYLSGRKPGDAPFTLLDFFKYNAEKFQKDKNDFLTIVDESHMTIPQVRGMYNGDRARKTTLVEHGFRLPSALDNRPLKFDEFEKRANQVIFTSATPEEYEITKSTENRIINSKKYYEMKEDGGNVNGVVEQLIRPTGLLDPIIEVRKTEHQIDDLVDEIRKSVAKNQRVLVTTLTKRMSEDLTEYLKEMGIKVTYLHADIDTLERPEILKQLRSGVVDVVVGINLLREGLDLPEVSLVAILDADKEGFLRSDKALIQTIGRVARHQEGRVIMYADKITGSMERAIEETKRRRKAQKSYNKKHGITPLSIQKAIRAGFSDYLERIKEETEIKIDISNIPKDELGRLAKELEQKMDLAAKNLEFEKAAEYRDQIEEIKDKMNSKF